MSKVAVEERVALGEKFSKLRPEERAAEVLRHWGCCPEGVKMLLHPHDAIGHIVNVHSTIRDEQIKAKCREALERSRAQAPYRLLDHRPAKPKMPWSPGKVLSLIERVALSPALPPELEAAYLS